MQWEFIVALVIAIPVILFPAVLVWYLNIGGLVQAVQKARRKTRAATEESVKAAAGAHVAVAASKGQSTSKEPGGTGR
jgi:hypothetical protein